MGLKEDLMKIIVLLLSLVICISFLGHRPYQTLLSDAIISDRDYDTFQDIGMPLFLTPLIESGKIFEGVRI